MAILNLTCKSTGTQGGPQQSDHCRLWQPAGLRRQAAPHRLHRQCCRCRDWSVKLPPQPPDEAAEPRPRRRQALQRPGRQGLGRQGADRRAGRLAGRGSGRQRHQHLCLPPAQTGLEIGPQGVQTELQGLQGDLLAAWPTELLLAVCAGCWAGGWGAQVGSMCRTQLEHQRQAGGPS